MEIIEMPVGRLIPYVRNARTHSADQIAQIAASIAEFGFTNPILVGGDAADRCLAEPRHNLGDTRH